MLPGKWYVSLWLSEYPEVRSHPICHDSENKQLILTIKHFKVF